MVDGAHVLTPRVCGARRPRWATSRSRWSRPCRWRSAQAPTAVSGRTVPPAESAAWDQAAEDRLLASVDWQRNGYELFRLARSFNDAAMGWFGCLLESSCFAMSRATFEQLGGFEQRFQSPGGGLVSLDFFRRAVARQDLPMSSCSAKRRSTSIHGGAASGAKPGGEHPWPRFQVEYAVDPRRPVPAVRAPADLLRPVPAAGDAAGRAVGAARFRVLASASSGTGSAAATARTAAGCVTSRAAAFEIAARATITVTPTWRFVACRETSSSSSLSRRRFLQSAGVAAAAMALAPHARGQDAASPDDEEARLRDRRPRSVRRGAAPALAARVQARPPRRAGQRRPGEGEEARREVRHQGIVDLQLRELRS